VEKQQRPRSSKPPPGEKGKVDTHTLSASCVQDLIYDEADGKVREAKSKATSHHRLFHRSRRMGIGKFQSGDRNNRFTKREDWGDVGEHCQLISASVPRRSVPGSKPITNERQRRDIRPSQFCGAAWRRKTYRCDG